MKSWTLYREISYDQFPWLL